MGTKRSTFRDDAGSNDLNVRGAYDASAACREHRRLASSEEPGNKWAVNWEKDILVHIRNLVYEEFKLPLARWRE